jgi:hypothetical protein
MSEENPVTKERVYTCFHCRVAPLLKEVKRDESWPAELGYVRHANFEPMLSGLTPTEMAVDRLQLSVLKHGGATKAEYRHWVETGELPARLHPLGAEGAAASASLASETATR